METFRALLEAAPDAMLIVDGSGRVTLANGQAARMFGYAREELLGKPIEDLMPARFRERHVAHRMGYMKEPRLRPMGEGRELFGVRRDGSEFPIEISLSPLGEGRERVVLAAMRDVTERKRAEEELRVARVARPLVRRIVRELVDRTRADRATLQAVGEGLAREADASTLEEFVGAFSEMGFGQLDYAGEEGGRYRFTARDLIERREGARLTTCFLTVGFLSGAVARAVPSSTVLGTEVACQSRGDPECQFVVQAKPAKR